MKQIRFENRMDRLAAWLCDRSLSFSLWWHRTLAREWHEGLSRGIQMGRSSVSRFDREPDGNMIPWSFWHDNGIEVVPPPKIRYTPLEDFLQTGSLIEFAMDRDETDD
jgi:hypothetical protein